MSEKAIPFTEAKDIGLRNGYTQVIITAFDRNTGITSVCTWGESQEDCEQAAQGGNFVKKALGWPPEKCNDKPDRQIRREKAEEIVKMLVSFIDDPSPDDTINLAKFVGCATLARNLIKEIECNPSI